MNQRGQSGLPEAERGRQRIRVIGLNYSGQAVDVALLVGRLRALGDDVRPTFRSKFGIGRRIAQKARLNHLAWPRFDLNVFIEQPEHWWLPTARRSVVVPNPDWLTPYGTALLHRMDAIWCKSHVAVRIFQALGLNAQYLGFSTLDPLQVDLLARRSWNRCLHVGGSSSLKGTEALVRLWAKNPQWPLLSVVSQIPELRPLVQDVKNIELFWQRLDAQELIALRHHCGVHIQPSEAEGYGHVLAESMASRAVVITTDAPPMNELISPETGHLVQADEVGRHFLAARHVFREASMTAAIEKVLDAPDHSLVRVGVLARDAYLCKDAAFTKQLSTLCTDIAS